MKKLSSPIAFALIITAVFAVTTAVAAYIALKVQNAELSTRLYHDTQYLAQSLEGIYQSNGVKELKKQIKIQTQYDRDGSILAMFWDKNSGQKFGNLNLDTPFSGPKELFLHQEIIQLKNFDEESDGAYYGYGIMTPSGWIITARDSRWVTDSQELLQQSILWGLFVAMIAVAIAAFLLAQMTSKRVKAINSVLSEVAQGNIAARCQFKDNDNSELGIVANRINLTLDHLQTSIDNLQQVSMDIAHDLRRPLTRIRLRLEQGRTSIRSQEILAEQIDNAIEELDNLSNTFDAILRLAQIESGAQSVKLQLTDLSQICTDIYEMFEPVVEDSGRTLHLDSLGEKLLINADANLLQQAIINLLENAIRYTPSDTHITIRLVSDPSKVSLSVCDNGLGIPECEFDKVIQRFYRIDSSRNSESTGLGLSLVNAIAIRHNARLTLRDNAPGLCVELSFDLINSE